MTAPNIDGTVIMTTPQLINDLKEVDHLIASLRMIVGGDADDIDDLRWLQGRRRYIQGVLTSRQAQRGKKIISLDLWRYGGIAAAELDANAA